MANSSGSTREFTLRALLLGLFMAVVLGAANAYLGIRAGQTVAATFPAAVVSMVVIRGLFKGSLLEENIARTTASVGEALAAGAIFTLPAFLMAGAWEEFNYWESTLLMLVGGLLGILFVVILRRSMVTDPDLPFPESVAAAEIHRAGKGASGGRLLFQMMGTRSRFSRTRRESSSSPTGFPARSVTGPSRGPSRSEASPSGRRPSRGYCPSRPPRRRPPISGSVTSSASGWRRSPSRAGSSRGGS